MTSANKKNKLRKVVLRMEGEWAEGIAIANRTGKASLRKKHLSRILKEMREHAVPLFGGRAVQAGRVSAKRAWCVWRKTDDMNVTRGQ